MVWYLNMQLENNAAMKKAWRQRWCWPSKLRKVQTHRAMRLKPWRHPELLHINMSDNSLHLIFSIIEPIKFLCWLMKLFIFSELDWCGAWLHACSVAQLCPTLCDPMDCSPPGSSVHGILHAKILEWVAVSFSRGSSWPRDWIQMSFIGRWILYHWALPLDIYSHILFKCKEN